MHHRAKERETNIIMKCRLRVRHTFDCEEAVAVVIQGRHFRGHLGWRVGVRLLQAIYVIVFATKLVALLCKQNDLSSIKVFVERRKQLTLANHNNHNHKE